MTGWALILIVCSRIAGGCTEVPQPSLMPMTHIDCLIAGNAMVQAKQADTFVCRLEDQET